MTSEEDAALERRIPHPVGYRILIAVPSVSDVYESGIIKADTTKQHETLLTMVGSVIDMGAQCYQDPQRFPSGPWCVIGDWVMFRANSGTRFKVDGTEYRLLNDDSIEAVVDDPTGITRI